MFAILMVSTTDDNTTELAENFLVVINSTNQTDRATIGFPNEAAITIEENDPGTYIYYMHICLCECLLCTSEFGLSFKPGVCTCTLYYIRRLTLNKRAQLDGLYST